MGEGGEVEEGLGGVPFRGWNGGRGGGTRAGEVAVGGEVVDAAAEGEESEVGFKTALEAGEGGIILQQRGEGLAGAGDLAAEGGG